MSQENVETVGRAIAGINARDIDAYLACCTENVELLLPMAGAEYLGADGIKRFFTDIEDIGPDFRIEVQRTQAIGDSNAIAFLRFRSTGRASGIVTAADSTAVYDFIEGKIRRVRIFLDRDEALKAAGLAEYAMSQENVEVVRSLYDGWLRGEIGTDKFDPEISMVESATLPGAVSAYGVEAVARYMRSFAKHWEQISFEPQEYIDAGEQVVVVARLIGRGKKSGVEVTRTWAYVWTLRGQKALSMVGYADRDEALKAAGLAE
jgi:uncharacterized protein